jgi:DNA-binding response OmpR family regulator
VSRAKEFQRLLSDLNPDVLLLERFLPDIDGMDLLSRVRAAGHLFPVLLHSDEATGEDRVRGLELGADEYLSKPLIAKELFLRIEKLLGWPDRISPRAAASLDCFEISGFLFDPSERTLSLGEKSLRLGRGDIAILLRFCLSPGVTLSRDELARSSGSLVDVSNSRSLDMRISNLRRQLGFLSADLAEMLETVRGRGYRLCADIRRVELAA